MSSPPAFIDISEQSQAVELCKYFEDHGAKFDVPEDASCAVRITALAKNCAVCLKPPVSDEDGLMCMNSIFSLFHIVSADDLVRIVELLCQQITADVSEKNAQFRLQLLQTLFLMLHNSPLRATIWLHIVEVAQKGGLLQSITTDLNVVKKWIEEWSCGRDVARKVFRSLHDVLKSDGQTARATKVLVELLSSSGDQDYPESREDARQCVISAIADPGVFLMDHLLELRPVEKLEGELIHDLLKIFVSGSFDDYMSFYKANSDFVDRLGLSHEANQQKMHLLTLISLSARSGEVTFSTLEQELSLSSMEVEFLFIEALRMKLVQGKIDQLQKKIVVSSSLQRTFGRPQWEYLRSQLESWRKNLDTVHESLSTSIAV